VTFFLDPAAGQKPKMTKITFFAYLGVKPKNGP